MENFEDLKKELDSFIKTSQIKTSSILEDYEKTNLNLSFVKTSPSKIKTISYLGPVGTHTHAAASSLFHDKELIPSNTISSVFEKIMNKEADAGVVPAENSTEGMVCETYDNLVTSDVFINVSVKRRIHHNLLARTKNIQQIKTVVSHPQAIAQTRKWLKKNLPDAELVTGASTTKVINQYNDSAVAFIGTKIAAKEYGLNILAEYIEDLSCNVTDFYIISKNKKLNDIYKAKKIMIVVIIYDIVGSLKDILSVFFKHSINLTKIFSRPSRLRQGDYIFLLKQI